jgi:hypothetical protein
MTRVNKWIPFLVLLLCAGLVGTLEYLPFRVTNPLRFHMERPSSDDALRKRTSVALYVENTSKYPVVYYGGSMQWENRPACHFCQLKGSSGNGVVIPPGKTYTHHREMSGRELKTVRDSKTEMRYYWTPQRQAWFAGTFLPALKSRLPSKWTGAIPQIRPRREVEPVEVPPAGKTETS